MKGETVITFHKAKITENTVVFKEDELPDTPPKVGTLYLQKWFAGETVKLQITIKPL